MDLNVGANNVESHCLSSAYFFSTMFLRAGLDGIKQSHKLLESTVIHNGKLLRVFHRL